MVCWMGGGVVNLLWNNILTPSSHPFQVYFYVRHETFAMLLPREIGILYHG